MTDLVDAVPNRPLARIIRAEDADSWIDGYAFLERAKAEAEAIRATAREEIAKAREVGRIEGRKAGEAEAAALLMRTQADIANYLDEAEPRLITLAMEILQQVLGAFSNGELVACAARQAINAFSDENGVTINVAPEIVDDVKTQCAAFDLKNMAIRVVADRHLSATQCTVTTPSASIDVGIETQLAAIRAMMMGSSRGGA
ncbi:type III secretion system stator protein SctL [Brucella sp. BE17]|uniref:type III secretion system stator protein SctL n=1 Tax=Brucella sp. BE17 TaxID=3142977 RepID=UPI0031BA6C85